MYYFDYEGRNLGIDDEEVLENDQRVIDNLLVLGSCSRIDFEIKDRPFFVVIDGCTRIDCYNPFTQIIVDYDFKIKKVVIYLCACGKFIVNEWYGNDNFIIKTGTNLREIRDSYRQVLRPLESSVVNENWRSSRGNFVLDLGGTKDCNHFPKEK